MCRPPVATGDTMLSRMAADCVVVWCAIAYESRVMSLSKVVRGV